MSSLRMSRADTKVRTRQRLLDSAAAVFATKGFVAATVEEIADGAGFTRGAFYANFADKAEALWELVETENEARFSELVTELDATEMDAKMDVLQAWFDRLMGTRPLMPAFGELVGQVGQTAEGKRRMAGLFAMERRAVARVIAEVAHVLGHTLPVPAEHMAAIGIAIGNGLAQQHLVDPEAVPSALFSDAQAYLFLGVLAAEQVPALKRDGRPPSGRAPRGGRRR